MTRTSHPQATAPAVGRSGSTLVAALCGTLILFDGYDLVVYGNVVPALLAEPGWGLTPARAGQIASLTLIGMAVGALLAGTVADRVGRRSLVLVSLAWFSVSMAVCAVAPNVLVFEVSRAVGGLGLGAMFPLATALVIEFTAPRRRARVYVLTTFGYLVGGVVAAGLGLLLIQSVGWRVMFWIGAAPILLLPLLFKMLPESTAWLVARGRHGDAVAQAELHGVEAPPAVVAEETRGRRRRGTAVLFGDGYAVATVMLWGVQFCSLLLVFGMVTWLPTIMTRLDYTLGFALAFVLVLNVGAAIGAFAAARFADRIGPRPAVVTLFVLGAVAVAALALRPGTTLVFLLIGVAGAGTLGTQILVNVFASSLYPTAARTTGLGWALGVGRLGGIVGPSVGGALLAAGLGAQWNFYVFAIVAAAGGLLALLLPLTPVARVTQSADPAEPATGDGRALPA
ncbi:MFS transporter [Kineococcus sp. LSe6-4]|uniref:MFS transporter n=1 Tax=Kineococcus halophytocola TaxID=3234027 RepID=A0ABV4GVV8_9ACTN